MNRSSLTGRKVRCLISEPWDFASSAGANLLAGVVAASYWRHGAETIALDVNPFVAKGEQVSRLLCRPRHVGFERPGPRLAAGERVSFNMYFSKPDLPDEPGYVFSTNTDDVGTLRPLLIGSIELSL